jgi:hypothetical protein
VNFDTNYAHCRLYLRTSSVDASLIVNDDLDGGDGGNVLYDTYPFVPLISGMWVRLTLDLELDVTPSKLQVAVDGGPPQTFPLHSACAAAATIGNLRLGFYEQVPSPTRLELRYDNVVLDLVR